MISPGPEQLHAPRIGVVVPYFQRDAGLLYRALCSVAAQEYGPVQVVVVDDGSPRAAAEEITPRLLDALPGLTVIRQSNLGVSAARNAALDALAQDVTAIALLDSDDYWETSHLRKAAAALSLGADFFFSNSTFEGKTTDQFQEYPRRDLLFNSSPAEGAPGIRRWSWSPSTLMSVGCPFATSTVVFRRAVMPELRFPVTFRRAGEDQMAFWELFVRSSVIMFCTESTLVSGSGGLGTWRNSTFGSVANLVRLTDEIRLRRHVIDRHPLNAIDRQLIQRAIASRRSLALYSALHLLRRRRPNVLKEILYLFRSDPMCAASWCLDLPRFMYRKISGAPITGR